MSSARGVLVVKAASVFVKNKIEKITAQERRGAGVEPYHHYDNGDKASVNKGVSGGVGDKRGENNAYHNDRYGADKCAGEHPVVDLLGCAQPIDNIYYQEHDGEQEDEPEPVPLEEKPGNMEIVLEPVDEPFARYDDSHGEVHHNEEDNRENEAEKRSPKAGKQGAPLNVHHSGSDAAEGAGGGGEQQDYARPEEGGGVVCVNIAQIVLNEVDSPGGEDSVQETLHTGRVYLE